jgi:hypothetical protein
MQLRRIWGSKMAGSANENILALGGKIFLQGETGNATSNLGNIFGTSVSS